MGEEFTCTACDQEYLEFEDVEAHPIWEDPGRDQIGEVVYGFEELREFVQPMEPVQALTATMDGEEYDAGMEMYPISFREALHRRAKYEQNEEITVFRGAPVAFELEIDIGRPEPDEILCEYCYAPIFENEG